MFLEKAMFDPTQISHAWAVIQEDNAELDLLLMGNSRMYNTIDPAVLNQKLGIKSALLGSSDQYLDLTLINMEIALKHVKPKAVIVGASTITLDNKDRILSKNKGYIYNNFDGVNNYWDKFNALIRVVGLEDIPDGMFQLFSRSSTSRHSRLINLFTGKRHVQTENLGFTSKKTNNIPKDLSLEDVYNTQLNALNSDERMPMKAYQLDTLSEFIKLLRDNDIDLYILQEPVFWLNTEQSLLYNELLYQLKDEKDIICYSLQENMLKIGLNEKDFADDNHVNNFGAEKVTNFMVDWIRENVDLN
ncbi:MAG: hypothetical protein GYA87_01175 [Christensenellaceae bacterium]|nr:hypothetical protein [Christensenellaceae bacterium]